MTQYLSFNSQIASQIPSQMLLQKLGRELMGM